jgi:hypothetical protein
MFHDGYEQLTNIDISPIVIEQMKVKNTTSMNCTSAIFASVALADIFSQDVVMDVTDMSSMESGSFTSVIDKGTLDALLVRPLLWFHLYAPKLTLDGTSAEKEAPKTQIKCMFLYAAMSKPDLEFN